jgi:threonyl-tRNA synthetase
VQAVVIAISDEKHGEYANAVLKRLQAAGIRSEVDNRKERMNAKVRDAQLRKIPYMLVVGDKEAAADAAAVRLRSNENLGALPLDEFIVQARKIIGERAVELWPTSAATGDH